MREKRLRVDSVESQVTAMLDARTKIEPTTELLPREAFHFDAIVNSRESASWSDNDRFLATELAKNYRRLEEMGADLDKVGFMMTNERGTKVANPIFSATCQLMSSIQAANRALGLSASQRGLSGSNQAKRNAADASAKETIKRVSENPLLA
jgi:hypothetical protein